MTHGLSKAAVAGLVVLAAISTLGHEERATIQVAGPLGYVRILSDLDGTSHFDDGELAFELIDFAPPAPPVSVSEAMAAEAVAVISSPAGWHGDWHPAPRRQLMFILSGELEVQVADGEERRFGPGAVLLVEDTIGTGHVSAVVGEERCFIATVALSDGDVDVTADS
jgi:quercetin dioxygenase-like cupin family protein